MEGLQPRTWAQRPRNFCAKRLGSKVLAYGLGQFFRKKHVFFWRFWEFLFCKWQTYFKEVAHGEAHGDHLNSHQRLAVAPHLPAVTTRQFSLQGFARSRVNVYHKINGGFSRGWGGWMLLVKRGPRWSEYATQDVLTERNGGHEPNCELEVGSSSTPKTWFLQTLLQDKFVVGICICPSDQVSTNIESFGRIWLSKERGGRANDESTWPMTVFVYGDCSSICRYQHLSWEIPKFRGWGVFEFEACGRNRLTVD